MISTTEIGKYQCFKNKLSCFSYAKTMASVGLLIQFKLESKISNY